MGQNEIDRAILAVQGTPVRVIEREPPIEVGIPYNQWQCSNCGLWFRYGDEDSRLALSCAKEHMESEHKRPLTTASFRAAEIRQRDRRR